MTLRVLFVAEPADEAEVRLRIGRALRAGWLDGPGGPSRWKMLGEGASAALPEDRPLLDRLMSA